MRIVEPHDSEVIRIDDDSVFGRLTGFLAILTGVATLTVYLNLEVGSGEDPGPWALFWIAAHR